MPAGGPEIGNAYINVIPKLEGSPEALGNEFGAKMSGGLKGAIGVGAVAVGNILANMVTSVASSIGEQITKTFWNYADYEQLVGGVDTIFKESSAQVQANAQAAFATVGMSANQYMENVTGFSASLIQSLDGDTQKAASVADMAMRDMSDNANKMGTDIGRITDAYQGFARGQYQLLDNLKLGYGGTKEEMQRLLSDAEAISGIHYDIGNYSDVIEAIHVIQEDMGIAGTTMLEGSATISGSLNQLNAAWENFLTAIGDGGQTMDINTVTQNLVFALTAAAKNVVPALANIAMTIATALPGAFAEAIGAIIPQMREAITAQFGEQGGAMFDGFVEAASGIGEKFATVFANIQGVVEQAMPIIQDAIVPTMELIGSVIDTVLNVIMDAVLVVTDFLNANVMPTIQNLAAIIGPVIAQIAADITAAMPVVQEIMLGAFTAIQDFANDVWPNLANIIQTVMGVISGVISVAWPAIQAIIGGVMSAVQGIVSGVWNVITGIVKTAVGVISGIISGLSSVVNTVSSIFNGIKNAIMTPINTAKNAIKTAIDTIKSIFNGLQLKIPLPKIPKIDIDGGEAPWGIGGQGRLPSFHVSWAAHGGIVDDMTLIGAGERGPELIWPGYEPYLSQYADAIAQRMDTDGGDARLLVAWLTANLGPIIETYAPTATPREFGRMVRSVV